MRTVLTVDDNEYVRTSIVEFLSLFGAYRVIAAATGASGLAAAASAHPDLILLDINMPDMNGLDVLKRLKEDPETRAIPVIMVTGDDAEATAQKALCGFAEHYVVKPFDMFLLHARIARIIKGREPRRAVA